MRASLHLLSLLAVACGHGHDHDHAHDHAHADTDPHRHEAPRGGVLVELGEHAAHVELLLDPEAGELTLYSLDAHAEQAVRLAAPTLEVVVGTDQGELWLELAAVASALTGERVGDSSEFRAVDPGLVGLVGLSGRIPAIEVRGVLFEDVRFPMSD
jgi:hypothetical protein